MHIDAQIEAVRLAIASAKKDAEYTESIEENSVSERAHEAALRAALATLEAARWRPIESAPCDDTFALVAWRDGCISTEDLDHDSDPKWWADRGATHWRPLPAPPEEK